MFGTFTGFFSPEVGHEGPVVTLLQIYRALIKDRGPNKGGTCPPPPYFGLKKGIAEGRTTIISEYYAGGSGIILIEAWIFLKSFFFQQFLHLPFPCEEHFFTYDF